MPPLALNDAQIDTLDAGRQRSVVPSLWGRSQWPLLAGTPTPADHPAAQESAD